MKKENHENALSVGIDIGTTTVSAAVYDINGKKEVKAFTVAHNSYTECAIFFEQNVSLIIEEAEKLLDKILNSYKNIVSIGITGQMHGIVYLNKDAEAVSSLITWQDKRADEVLDSGKSACEEIYDITGEKISTGYGIATHYYNLKKGLVPNGTAVICSIMDFFASKICKNKEVITHASVGASLGLFDTEGGTFMEDKLALLGIDSSILPRVTSKSVTVGKYRDIPVFVPIGDNQAGFLGASRGSGADLFVNFGTGSQVSCVSDFCKVDSSLELRPYIDGKYLIVGSALSGGYAYSMLESFFGAYAGALGINEPQYKTINALAKQAYKSNQNELLVDTSFLGKRSDPCAKGSIKEIGKDNFTPQNLALGVLKGMCRELYELYLKFPKKAKMIVASGGAVKKNEVLSLVISDTFALPLELSTKNEEAAIGAAVFATL